MGFRLLLQGQLYLLLPFLRSNFISTEVKVQVSVPSQEVSENHNLSCQFTAEQFFSVDDPVFQCTIYTFKLLSKVTDLFTRASAEGTKRPQLP
jgi:hypothetical protein